MGGVKKHHLMVRHYIKHHKMLQYWYAPLNATVPVRKEFSVATRAGSASALRDFGHAVVITAVARDEVAVIALLGVRDPRLVS